jgi:hypothetical protein
LGCLPLRGREGVTLAIPQNDTVGMISTEQKFWERPVFLMNSKKTLIFGYKNAESS